MSHCNCELRQRAWNPNTGICEDCKCSYEDCRYPREDEPIDIKASLEQMQPIDRLLTSVRETKSDEMHGVREYAEEYTVRLVWLTPDPSDHTTEKWDLPDGPRLVVHARNEGGHNSTQVDLLDLLAWLKTHRPDLL